jgi:hypothetical protein
MDKKVKLTVSLPSELSSFTDEMAEGYRVMAKEQKQLAALASGIEHEVIPEWN